ncbi:class I SAM-dependent methyltransferase [Euzebya sp.]|uniref:class I SAM-dependent DNA methyltransferase n=1 Tax=Euzebya sp. TaxID=1971409 RepID=UPI00351714A3
MPTNFDDRAETWDDDPAKVDRARVVAAAIRASVPLTPSTRLLEYGAGTGLVSQTLAGHVGPITLAEPSAGMRRVMLAKVAAGTLPDDARIWDLDLATGAVPDERFDLVATVMTLHHIPDLAPVLRGFATLLQDGGHLCVVDLEAEDGSSHSTDPGFDGHHGFEVAALQDELRVAGFSDVHVERCHEIEKDGASYPLFLATAVVRSEG